MSLVLSEAIPLLRRAPETLRALLSGLGDPWLGADEGPDTFTPRDVIGHLIFAEETAHPELGPVTLSQLLATWVGHDLTHVAQVVRVMAKRYQQAVGPWRAYLRILQ